MLSHDELGYISDQFNSMVDERRRFEEQLVLSQKQELVGTLVSGVSHDFNNIIGGIAAVPSHLNMSLDEPKSMSKEEQKDFLEIIEQNCDRASSLVGQLLSFGKKKKLNLANVAIADIFRGVEVLSRLSLDRSLKFIIDYPDMNCMIQADQTQLEQALLNICINAGHAMTIMRKEGEAWGGELHMKSESSPRTDQNPECRITISDTGIGMDEETKNCIFDPFFSTKEKGKGNGIGLSMVYRIIQDHRGRMQVTSQPDKGTVFSHYLPRICSSRRSVGVGGCSDRELILL